MKSLNLILLGLLIVTSASSCFTRREYPALPSVLAVVNGNQIKEDQWTLRFNLERGKYDADLIKDDERLMKLKKEILDRMIENRLIVDWGMTKGITLTAEEEAEGIKGLKRGYSEREFRIMLDEKGIPHVQWRDMAHETLLVQKILKEVVESRSKVTPQEVSHYYQQNRGKFFMEERVRARHIITDTQEKAENLLERIHMGEVFTKLAMMHSLSPDRSRGGDLGYFGRGTHPKEFEICFDMIKGEVSPIVKSPYGFHLFKLIDKKPRGLLSLSEVETEIRLQLMRNKRAEIYPPWIETLRSQANIEIKGEALKELSLR